MDEITLGAAIEYGLQRNGYTKLRPNQETILKQVLSGKDVLFCSPTGSGKSLIFEVAPFAFHLISGMKSCCIVVSPLAALMKSKAQELRLKGTVAVYIREMKTNPTDEDAPLKTDIVAGIQSGKFEIIFASPETLLESHRDVMLQISKSGFLKAIFIDEAHCIKKL